MSPRMSVATGAPLDITSGNIAATVPAFLSRARRMACFFALIAFLSVIYSSPEIFWESHDTARI